MRVGVDLDGVLADFNTSYIALIDRMLGVKLPPVSDQYPDVWDYDKAAGLTSEQRNKLWEHIKTSNFQATHRPLPGALDVIERLDRLDSQGHSVYFVTSRGGDYAKYHATWWLRMHGMLHPSVAIAPGFEDKAPIAKGLHLDVFIEDKPETNMEILKASPKTRCYLVDQPYNRWADQPKNYGIRVANAGEALDIEFGKEETKAA